MKTNVTMTRKMGTFDVFQRTSDGMFNATALLKQWNEFNHSNKELKEYFKLNSTNEFANTIAKRENLNGGKSTYLTLRGKYNGGTWMHPMLFIDFCMWHSVSYLKQHKEIPRCKVGGRILFTKQQLTNWAVR